MADEDKLKIIKEGVTVWNNWKKQHRHQSIDLRGAKLAKVNLRKADLKDVDFSDADLTGSDLTGANFKRAIFRGAHLSGATLRSADLVKTDFFGADITNANLKYCQIVEANFEQAKLSNCKVYGISAWALKGTPQDQSGLLITDSDEAAITVDDLQLAQFIYLLLNNKNVRSVIDTMTSKVVLILGRFTDERKEILDAIRAELRRLKFAPIIFDFDKPASKDLTGTVETLARMARFIIADLTDPSSIPHELATLVPHLRTTPIQLLKLKGASTYSMFENYLGAYKWLLEPYEYEDKESLISALYKVITPANDMAQAYRKQGHP
ncbi:MAG: pentapeptide repeat-containing protein [Ginsengibacter sp.]